MTPEDDGRRDAPSVTRKLVAPRFLNDLRVIELSYTAWDLEAFASDCGYSCSPFRWDESRRFLLRCELDAAFFHLYGIARDDVDYIPTHRHILWGHHYTSIAGAAPIIGPAVAVIWGWAPALF